MNMNTYKIELNKQFVPGRKFYIKNSEDLRELKSYLDILFKNEKDDKTC